eukprot:gnl/TRDRNA2_/TRDRNA2_197730_c0_seq1.p1 gnl/TRDRNA2_/TRDRNA2_197730_c0~~gnl/TRDRNA2_/TRDRNA2_197730_c0_seq1.p1  ORF type:complete len:526 (+),score=80.01 gnl/TRDRNA2_/TRDRNA2_197730_c0_seq1:61-1638(+)
MGPRALSIRSKKVRTSGCRRFDVKSSKVANTGLGALPSCTPEEAGLDAKLLEDHRQRCQWQASLGLIPGLAECIIGDKGVAYLDLMGRADREQGTPMRPTTLFRCFSMTKPITAVGLMLLVEEGRVSLDDPVEKFIPSFDFRNMKVIKKSSTKKWEEEVSAKDFEPAERSITLKHLLCHTSGLAYGPDRNHPRKELKAHDPDEEAYLELSQTCDDGNYRTLASFCDGLAALPLRCQPGTKYIYGHSMDVVGRVIEVVSGMPLDRFLREDVFRPLGMMNTSFEVTRGHLSDLAGMYEVKKEFHHPYGNDDFSCKLVRLDGKRPEDSAWFGRQGVLAGGGMYGSLPAGGLVSCLKDTALFCHMIMSGGKTATGGRLLKQSTMRALWRDWLQLRSVVERTSTLKVRGWPHGKTVGWCPLGHVRQKDKCLFMGGWSTSWAIYPQWRLTTISLSQSLYYFSVPEWDRNRDELDAVVEENKRRQRRKIAGAARRRLQSVLARRSTPSATAKRRSVTAPPSPRSPKKRRLSE